MSFEPQPKIEGTTAEGASATGVEPILVAGKNCDGNVQTLPVCSTTPSQDGNALFISPRPNKLWEESFGDEVASGLNTDSWTEIVKATGMTVSQTGGNAVIVSGTTANEETIYRSKTTWSDSMVLRAQTTLSAYNANTRLWYELVDVVGDSLAITSSTEAISITKIGHGFTTKDVGKLLFIGAFKNIVGGTPIPGQWAIASITSTDVFVVTATGSTGTISSGTCSVWGYNSIRLGIVNSSTTTALAGTTRNGRNAVADSSITVSTITSGSYDVVAIEKGVVTFSNSTVNSTSALSSRALRNVGIPSASIVFYLQIRVTNASTGPGVATTNTVSMLRIEDNAALPVSFPTQRGSSVVGNSLGVAVSSVPTNMAVNIAQINGSTQAGGNSSVLPVAGGGEMVHVIPAFSTGSTTPADGTNSLVYDAFPGRDAEWILNVGGGNVSNTLQVEGSNNMVNWFVLPVNRIGNLATSMYALTTPALPASVGFYQGRTYGFAKLRVHQTARTTTGTSGLLRIIPSATHIDQSITYFSLTVANTTEVTGSASYTTAINAFPTGGIRTMGVVPLGSAKAVLECDAITGTLTLVLEGSIDGGANYSALTMYPLGGVGGAGVTSVAFTGTTAIPQAGLYEADCSKYTHVRVRCSSYTSGTALGALKVVHTPSMDDANTIDWSYAAAASGIVNTNTAVTIKAAAAAGLRNYITGLDFMSEALTNATELAVRDGAGGTVLWRTKIPASTVTRDNIVFSKPLVGTAATLLEVVTLSASGSGAVYFNANGFVSY